MRHLIILKSSTALLHFSLLSAGFCPHPSPSPNPLSLPVFSLYHLCLLEQGSLIALSQHSSLVHSHYFSGRVTERERERPKEQQGEREWGRKSKRKENNEGRRRHEIKKKGKLQKVVEEVGQIKEGFLCGRYVNSMTFPFIFTIGWVLP